MKNSNNIRHLQGVLIAALTVLCLVFQFSEISSQEMPVPVALQVRLFAKILAYDRNLQAMRGNGLTVGVLFQSRFITSRATRDQFVEAVLLLDANGSGPLRCVAIEIGESGPIPFTSGLDSVDVFYVTPLRAFDLAGLIKRSRELGILTLTGVPEYVEAGLAVGIGSKGGRPRILINEEAAKQEGANFSAQLLKLAQLIK